MSYVLCALPYMFVVPSLDAVALVSSYPTPHLVAWVSRQKLAEALPILANHIGPLSVTIPDLTSDAIKELARLIQGVVANLRPYRVYAELFGFCVRNEAAPRIMNIVEGRVGSWAWGVRIFMGSEEYKYGRTELLMYLVRNAWITRGIVGHWLTRPQRIPARFTTEDMIRLIEFLTIPAN